MGRLEKKLNIQEASPIPYFSPTDKKEEPVTTEPEVLAEDEYYKEEPPIKTQKSRFKKFGFSKDSYTMATDIENSPSPKGILKKTFCGRPVDVHMLEDYLVWRISPLAIKTILSYGHSKTIEDMRGLLTTGDRTRGNPKTLIIIVIAVIALVAGILFLVYGPQLTEIMPTP